MDFKDYLARDAVGLAELISAGGITQRFIDAGVHIFGKTNTPEFGAKGITEPDAFRPCRNRE